VWTGAELTSLAALASFKQAAPSLLLKRAARASTQPALLGAPQAPRRLPTHPGADPLRTAKGADASSTPFALSLSKGLRRTNPNRSP
jgi:hypothetical protein